MRVKIFKLAVNSTKTKYSPIAGKIIDKTVRVAVRNETDIEYFKILEFEFSDAIKMKYSDFSIILHTENYTFGCKPSFINHIRLRLRFKDYWFLKSDNILKAIFIAIIPVSLNFICNEINKNKNDISNEKETNKSKTTITNHNPIAVPDSTLIKEK